MKDAFVLDEIGVMDALGLPGSRRLLDSAERLFLLWGGLGCPAPPGGAPRGVGFGGDAAD